MSLHISVVSIGGDRLADLPQVMKRLQYKIENAFYVDGGAAAEAQLNWNPDPNKVAKVAYESEGWTHIVDPELVLMDDDIWIEYSARWDTMVVGWVCEGASGSYGLTVFESGKKLRKVLSCEGKVVTDVGAPLDEEMDMDWADACEDDVLTVANRLGSEFDLGDRKYLVLYLDESEVAPP